MLAPFVTLLPAIIVLQLSGSIIGELGTHAGLQVSEISQLLLIVIVLGAGTDYGLFLVFRVREGIRDGLEAKEAVSLAVARVGESITASAGTVILALLSLLFATFGIYHDLGIPLAIGIATMLLAGLTLLPALMAVLGRAVFWPSRPRPGQAQGGAWGKVASRIVSRPVPTLIIGVVAFGALASGAAFYEPAGFGGVTSAPAHTEAAVADDIIAAHFPHASTNPTNLVFEFPTSVWSDPAIIVRAQQSLEVVRPVPLDRRTPVAGRRSPQCGTAAGAACPFRAAEESVSRYAKRHPAGALPGIPCGSIVREHVRHDRAVRGIAPRWQRQPGQHRRPRRRAGDPEGGRPGGVGLGRCGKRRGG